MRGCACGQGISARCQSLSMGTGAGSAVLSLGGATLRAGAAFTNEAAVAVVLNGTNGSATIDSATHAIVLAGPISGPAGFTKVGAGDLVLAGTNSFAGALVVSNGTLFANGAGSLPGGAFVATGATLRGSGLLDAVTVVTNGGTVKPGALAGAAPLTLAALNLRDGAAVAAFVGGTTAQVRVTGVDGLTAAASGINAIDILDGAVAVGQHTVIDYAGTIQGGGIGAFQLRDLPPRLGADARRRSSRRAKSAASSAQANETALPCPLVPIRPQANWTIDAPNDLGQRPQKVRTSG